MIVRLPCGCTVDDERVTTVHESDGHHYPLGSGPKTFCFRCDLYKPCLCSVGPNLDPGDGDVEEGSEG